MVDIDVLYLDSEPASVNEAFVVRMFANASDVEIRFPGKIPFKDRQEFHKHYKRLTGGSRYITYKIDENPTLGIVRALQGMRSTLKKRFLFVISKRPLPSGVYSVSDEKTVKLMTTFGWRKKSTSPSFELAIVKELIVTALSLLTDSKLSTHDNPVGCVFDAPADRAFLSLGMWGNICGDCRTKIKSKKLSDITIDRLLYIQKLAFLYHVEEAEYAMSAPNIFISYAKEDTKFATRIHDYLDSRGINVWMDKFNLRVGDHWEEKIKNVLSNSDFIVLCLSKASTEKRGFVQVETREAIRASQYMPSNAPFILPVKVDNCTIPDELSGIQCLDLIDLENQGTDGLLMLCENIKHHAKTRRKDANKKISKDVLC